MTDPLSVAGTIVGIVSLGLTVSKGLTTFIEAVRDAPEDLKVVQNDLSALCEVLEQIKDVLTLPRARLSERSLRSALANCSENFTDINARLESASVYIREKQQQQQQHQHQQQQGAISIKITRLARVTLSRNEHMRWFYKQGTIEKLRVNFLHSKLTLLLAVNIAELYRVEKERRAQVETKNQPSMVNHPADSTTSGASRDMHGEIVDVSDGDVTMVPSIGPVEPDGSDTTEEPADTQKSDSPTMQSATATPDIVNSLNMKRGLDKNPQQVELERSQLVDTILSLQKQVDRLEKHVSKRKKGRVKQDTSPVNPHADSEAGVGSKNETVDAEESSSAETSLGSEHRTTSDIAPSTSLSDVSEKSSISDEILKLWMMNINVHWKHQETHVISIEQANIPQQEIQDYLQTQTTSESRGVLSMLRKLNGSQRDSIFTHCQENGGEIRLIEEWETTRMPEAIGTVEMVNLAWITSHDSREGEKEFQGAPGAATLPFRAKGAHFGDIPPPPPPPPPMMPGRANGALFGVGPYNSTEMMGRPGGLGGMPGIGGLTSPQRMHPGMNAGAGMRPGAGMNAQQQQQRPGGGIPGGMPGRMPGGHSGGNSAGMPSELPQPHMNVGGAGGGGGGGNFPPPPPPPPHYGVAGGYPGARPPLRSVMDDEAFPGHGGRAGKPPKQQKRTPMVEILNDDDLDNDEDFEDPMFRRVKGMKIKGNPIHQGPTARQMSSAKEPRPEKAGSVSEDSDSDGNKSSEEPGEEDDDELDAGAAEKVVADLMSKWIDED